MTKREKAPFVAMFALLAIWSLSGAVGVWADVLLPFRLQVVLSAGFAVAAVFAVASIVDVVTYK